VGNVRGVINTVDFFPAAYVYIPGINPKPTRMAAAAAWASDGTLKMKWHYFETPHHDTVTCRFDNDRVEVNFVNSVTELLGTSSGMYNDTRPVLRGRLSGEG